MQIKVDSPIPSVLNNISSADRGVLQLQKGEIIQAVVQKQSGDGLYMLSFRGMTIEASTNLPLTPGQNLVLKSEGLENGRMVLKIAQPNEIFSARVSNHLQEMGLRTDDRLIAVAHKLIQYGLPVTRDNVENTLARTRSLGEFSPQNLDTSVWSLVSGLKNDKELLSALRDFLTSPTPVKTALEQTFQLLQARNDSAGKTSMLSANEFELGNAPLASTAKGSIDTSLTEVRQEGTSSTFQTGGELFTSSNRMQSIAELLRSVVSLIVTKGGESPELIAKDLQNNFDGQKEVLRALNLIQSVLADNSFDRIPDMENAIKLLQSAHGELMGQAAFNSADQNSNNLQAGAYYFALPVEVNGQDHLVELKVFREDRNKRHLDEVEELKLAISLNTANLGVVLFHLHWFKDQGIIIQGAVDNQDSKELIEKEFSGLQTRLKELGYQVQFVGMKVVAAQEQLRPVLTDDEGGATKTLGIDVRI